MNKGWLELESDPGLFTLLLEDIGVRGVQVEEIYDLQKALEGPVYGFIFLFKWIEERRARRKIIQEHESFVMDDQIVNNMFFAQQVIPNSCATHALLSVLLNCNTLPLGETLTKLKDFCKDMGPEEKGHAIGNMPDLASAHNSHARLEQRFIPEKEKQQGISTTKTAEAFHFVSYVPINGRLFELDGLKSYPIDHGPWGENEEWTERFRQVISDRLGMATGGEPYHDIRFNLMAVVPCRRQQLEHKLSILKTNRQIVLEALQQMVKVTTPLPESERAKLKNGGDVEGESPAEPLAVRVSQRLLERRNSGVVLPKLPSFLDGHDYAKSPISGEEIDDENIDFITVDTAGDVPDPNVDMGGIGESVQTTPGLADIDIARIKRNELHNDDSVKISIAVREDGNLSIPITVASTDVTKPLKIHTKFGKKQVQFTDGGETTDTASEGGTPCSSVNSSPNFKAQARQALKGPDDIPKTIPKLSDELKNPKLEIKEEQMESLKIEVDDDFVVPEEKPSPFSKHQGFTPKDLLDLLKNVESEIKSSEAKYQDEVEKRKKYKVDDCRRTHNYDQFICTFLSMLAEQGQLAELVEDQLFMKRRQGVNSGALKKTKKANNNRKKSKTKKKR